jgi:hypothetical protein
MGLFSGAVAAEAGAGMSRPELQTRGPALIAAALAPQVIDQSDDLIDPRQEILAAPVLRTALHPDSSLHAGCSSRGFKTDECGSPATKLRRSGVKTPSTTGFEFCAAGRTSSETSETGSLEKKGGPKTALSPAPAPTGR